MDLTLEEARQLVSNATLWPKVRDYLARGGDCVRFAAGAKSRLKLVDDGTRAKIDMWVEALGRAEEWKSVVDGEKVRALKAEFPGVYPEVFRYSAYFAKFKKADTENEEFMMLLLKLKFPEVYALCSS
jgi:hypothetical protein